MTNNDEYCFLPNYPSYFMSSDRAMDSKETRRIKKTKNHVELSEELKKELGEGTDVILDSKKLSKEEKRRQKLREEKKALKEQRKGKRAAKREALEVYF